VVFFFSSRRRHTRFKCDWSSDVCSSDLLGFLAELKAPFTDGPGNRLAPLALVLETYSRNPAGKHAVLEIFAREGYDFPDTPLMRSEERRVGTEGSAERAGEDVKNNMIAD